MAALTTDFWSGDAGSFFGGLGLKPLLSHYDSACYHGTNNEVAKKIFDARKFTSSDDGVIGPGVYFYERGEDAGAYDPALEAALAHAKVRYPGGLPNAVEVNVRTDYLFDTTNNANKAFFIAVADRLAQEFKKQYGENSPQLRRLSDLRFVARFIAEACPDAASMAAIRARFAVPDLALRSHMGVVVREVVCIVDYVKLWTN